MAPRLAPGEVARSLFGIDPDRDERASQLCAETLLTLAQNGYGNPEELMSPKRRQFAVRSLALGHNFLDLVEIGRVGSEQMSTQRYGELLSKGEDLLQSANLRLARDALQGLIDPSTHQGQPGGWLLRPFHESLLWFDARQDRNKPWTVRQVYMRGSGVTLARMLVDPPLESGAEAAASGTEAVRRIRVALQSDSPLARIATVLEAAVPDEHRQRLTPEKPEREAWTRGAEQALAPLAAMVCRHAEGVMRQGTASAPARLWQLRSILALDLAIHALRTAWERLDADSASRFLLLTFGGPPRAENRVRQLSERSYADARLRLRQATVATLADEMQRFAGEEEAPDWGGALINRQNQLSGVIAELSALPRDSPASEFERLARLTSDASDYGRAAEGFRVLIDTIGLLAGTGAYRFLTATPDLLAALVGALSAHMPMTSDEFFRLVETEWGLIVGPAPNTRLANELDGADLERNRRRAELLLADAGLALGLSDRTVMVGERAEWERA